MKGFMAARNYSLESMKLTITFPLPEVEIVFRPNDGPPLSASMGSLAIKA